MTENNKEILLKVDNLHTYFYTDDGVVKAVDGVDIVLKKGSTLGIVGESGSGKSVTALSIMNLLKDTKGKVADGDIFLNGEDILHISEEEKRRLKGTELGMIFQEPMTSLNPIMTIGDQISEGIIEHFKVSKEEALKRTIDMLNKVSIPRAEKIVKEYPFQLSGGMRQRVMIAMALVCQPKILIADEPTTALDVTIQAQILELIDEMKDLVGTSVIFITHDLGVIAEICDEVVVMYCGRVVETGDVYSIFKNPRHPYTEGLLKSIPKLGNHVEILESIPGNVPNPKYLPKGCKFEPRCSYSMDICKEEEPDFFEFPNGQKSRCWLCQKKFGGGDVE